MRQKYSYAQSLINNLVNKGKYEFTLSGKFEDVIGNDASIHFFGTTSTGKRDADPIPQADPAPDKYVEFKPSPYDPAPIDPPPPIVEIKGPEERNLPTIEGKKILLHSESLTLWILTVPFLAMNEPRINNLFS